MLSCSCLLWPCSTAAPTPSKPGKLHRDYKTHPRFPPKFGVGEVRLIVQKYGTHIMMLSGEKQSKLLSWSKNGLREQRRDQLWNYIVIWKQSCLHALNFPPTLDFLPGPAQVCRKRKIQKDEALHLPESNIKPSTCLFITEYHIISIHYMKQI